MSFFQPKEFYCKCGKCGLGYANMDHRMLQRLETARALAGIPFVITSSIRCKEHNTRVGGASQSAHVTGHAVDISCTSSKARHTIVKALFLAGFNRIGVSEKFIHADTSPDLEPNVIWTYPS